MSKYKVGDIVCIKGFGKHWDQLPKPLPKEVQDLIGTRCTITKTCGNGSYIVKSAVPLYCNSASLTLAGTDDWHFAEGDLSPTPIDKTIRLPKSPTLNFFEMDNVG